MDNYQFQKFKIINLYQPYIYYKIKNISNKNVAILSYTENGKSFLTFFPYPDYQSKEIKLTDIDCDGDFIQFGKIIVICFGIFNACLIFF